jgi:hypothetical protein
MHPLQPDITGLSDQELETKIIELTKKYFQAIRYVPGAASQISLMIDGYKWEQQRRILEKQRKPKDEDQSFEDLIRID